MLLDANIPSSDTKLGTMSETKATVVTDRALKSPCSKGGTSENGITNTPKIIESLYSPEIVANH